MSAIRCHFDGKAFIPDEPVKIAAGQEAEVHLDAPQVEFTGGKGATFADLLKSTAVGGWSGLFDPNLTSEEVSAELRQRSNMGSAHKRHAMVDLQEYWDEQRRTTQDPAADRKDSG